MAKQRSIFEEVGDTPRQAPVAGGVIDGARAGARRAIRLWLLLLFALVAAMILVGGLTRLTDSGLSITEWRPVTGAVPPLSEADWAAEFAKYQQSPQYRHLNQGMTIEAFRSIYWWEWGHRMLGRLVGLVWAAGFLGFLAARRIPAGWTGRLLFIGVLGGLQGAIGWWMVSSGLAEGMTSVASTRLAMHLGLAFVILGLLWWYAQAMGRAEAALIQARRARESKAFGLATGVLHLAFLQILIGALVAGIDAGRSFTDWPLMAGEFFPSTALDLSPWWLNLTENAGLVQFAHRMTGYLVLILAIVAWNRGQRSPHAATRTAFHLMLAAIALQVGLGIATVLSAAQIHAAITHQLGAILVWMAILRARFLAQYPIQQSIRGAK